MNQKDSIIDILAQLSRNRYPVSVLRERPLPDGVNPLCLTDYLCDEEFEVIINAEIKVIIILNNIFFEYMKGNFALFQRAVCNASVMETNKFKEKS